MADDIKENKPFGDRAWHHIRRNLISGFVLLLPVGITFFILMLIFRLAVGFLVPFFKYAGISSLFLAYLASLATVFLVLYFIGLMASLVVGRRIVHAVERFLLKVPLLKTFYSGSKQVVDTFTAANSANFQSVVLVEFPRKGIYALAFVTGRMIDNVGTDYYRLFIPTAPNPTTGFLEIVKVADVKHAGISVEEGIRIIISGGILGPSTLKGLDSIVTQ
jgi:uncharacterized membrane protein